MAQPLTPTAVLTLLEESEKHALRRKVSEEPSAQFLLVGRVTGDRGIEAFKAVPKFEIIASNLAHEQEEMLKAAFVG